MATYFYINLDRSTDRNQFMQSQFEALEINARRISAVDGFELPENEIRKAFGTNLIAKQSVNLGKLGCFLSHYKIYQIMEAENIPVALIMEDDMVIKEPRAKQVISEIEKLQDSWDIVHVAGAIQYKGNDPVFTQWLSRKKLCDDYFLSRYVWMHACTTCYMISRDYACRLLEEHKKLGGLFPCPIDHWLFDLAYATSWPHLLYKFNPENKYLPQQSFGNQERFGSTLSHPLQPKKKTARTTTVKKTGKSSPTLLQRIKLMQKSIEYILYGLLPYSNRDLPSQQEPRSHFIWFDKAGNFSPEKLYDFKTRHKMKVKVVLRMILRIFRPK